MSILGKIVGQLESGGSGGGSLGMNYIKTERHQLDKAGTYSSGFVIAKSVEDNKLYKFDVEMTMESTSETWTIYLSGFAYNQEVFILNYQIPSGASDAYGFIRGDKIVLGGATTGERYIQIEGYTTLTQEEIVWETPETTGNQLIDESNTLLSRIKSLESAKSTIESRLTALESAGSG